MLSNREALRQALDEELNNNSDVFLLGEEIGRSDGDHKITKGLFEKYGQWRVLDTPISEIGFTGLASGAAFAGLKPVVEFMTWNFALQAIDHIINSSAKTLYMSGGKIKSSIVFRGPNGPAPGYAAQHTHDFSSLYGTIPGLKVVAPFTAKDHKGLLKSAIRDPNPIIFLENISLYDNEYDYLIPESYLQLLNKAVVEIKGKDVTLIGLSSSLTICFKAAEILKKENISCEIINLISIRPIDKDTILKSVKKTRRAIVVEYSWPSFGIGSELSAIIHENLFSVLKSPVQRISGKDIPTPYSPEIEKMAYPDVNDVIEKIRFLIKN